MISMSDFVEMILKFKRREIMYSKYINFSIMYVIINTRNILIIIFELR